MARMTSMEALERKIEKAQARVSSTKKQYDSAIAILSDLLDKRDALKRDELVKAIMKSSRTYDEVLAFLSDEGSDKKGSKGTDSGKRSRKAKGNN